MDTDKMREEFEGALAKQAAEDGFAKPSLRRNKNNGDYVDPLEQAAWWAWQASRAAVVVDLPDPNEVHDTGDYCAEAIDAIEAQGLKVSP